MEYLSEEKWLAQLDIFSETTKLNERVEALKKTKTMKKTRASTGTTDVFEQMHAFILGRNMDFSVIKRQVTVHLSGLLDKFSSFLPVDCKPIYWDNFPPLPVSKLLEELIDLSSDGTVRARFNEVQLEAFWSQCGAEF